MKKNIVKEINQIVFKQAQKENLKKIMAESFARYSKYIIQNRALPDARDGLKPVQRRILYAMFKMGLLHQKAYKKSARITGEVMGKYHPHGDSSIYDTIVRLSQDWKMRIPLIDMQGNNGSIDGDPAAAMRYTEIRLTKEGEFLVENINKNIVNFVFNFDETETEPVILPTQFPNLLINGATGISAGYATKIPPHNPHEIFDALISLLEQPKDINNNIYKFFLGPDFPTGGNVLITKKTLDDILHQGSGSFFIASKYNFENDNKEKKLIIEEIPFEINKNDLIANIEKLRLKDNVSEILNIKDESSHSGLRIVIELKKNTDEEKIIAFLFKNTNLQIAFHYNMVAIIDDKPQKVGLLFLLNFYLNHQKENVIKQLNYDLKIINQRLHILEGLIKMVEVLDQIIKIIRASKNKTDSKQKIIEAFAFSEKQAEAIIMLHLYKLSNTDVEILFKEQKQLLIKKKQIEKILNTSSLLTKELKKMFLEMKEKLNTPRKTTISQKNIRFTKIRKEEEKKIVLTKKNTKLPRNFFLLITSLGRFFCQTKSDDIKDFSINWEKEEKILFLDFVNINDFLMLFSHSGQVLYFQINDFDFILNKTASFFEENFSKKHLIEVNVFSQEQQKLFLLTSALGYAKIINSSLLKKKKTWQKIIDLQAEDQLVSIDQKKLIDSRILFFVSKKGFVAKIQNFTDLVYQTLSTAGKKIFYFEQKNDILLKGFFAEEDSLIYAITSKNFLFKDDLAEIPFLQKNNFNNSLPFLLSSEIIIDIHLCSFLQDKKNTNIHLWNNHKKEIIAKNKIISRYNIANDFQIKNIFFQKKN